MLSTATYRTHPYTYHVNHVWEHLSQGAAKVLLWIQTCKM